MKINTIGHLVKANPIQTQFKPNLPDAQMSVYSILTKVYERNDIFAVPQNKANSNPIKPNFKPVPRSDFNPTINDFPPTKPRIAKRFQQNNQLSIINYQLSPPKYSGTSSLIFRVISS